MKYFIPIALIGYLLFLPLSFLPAYGELKYPAAAILLLFLTLNYRPKLVKTDLLIGLFLGFMLLSAVDIQNPSYLWVPLFNWLLLLMTALWIRPFFVENENKLSLLLQIIFFTTIAYTLLMMVSLYHWQWIPEGQSNHLFQMTISNEGGRTWSWLSEFPGPNWFRRGYGKNYNVTAVFPVLLSPVVLFHRYRHRWVNLSVKIVVLLGLFWIVNYFGSQLGLGLLIIYGLVAIWNIGSVKQLLIGLGITGLVLLLATPWLLEFWEETSSGLKNNNHAGRLALDSLALKVTGIHWFNGVGLGAWYYAADQIAEIGSKALQGNLGAGNTFGTYSAFIHNHNTKMLAEIGPLGFLSYLSIPLIVGINLLRKKIKPIQVKYALIFLGWYASATTLRFAVGDDNEISEVQWLGWLAFGLYTAYEKPWKETTVPKWMGVGLSGLLLMGFIGNFYANHTQLKAMSAFKGKEIAVAIKQLESIYMPGLKTSINDVEPIQRHLARWYSNEGCMEESEEAYQRAIDLLPLDPGLAQEFLSWLIKNKRNDGSYYEWAMGIENKYPSLANFTSIITICGVKEEVIIIDDMTKGIPSIAKARDSVVISTVIEDDLTITSGAVIILKPGFEVKKGKIFSAKVINCE